MEIQGNAHHLQPDHALPVAGALHVNEDSPDNLAATAWPQILHDPSIALVTFFIAVCTAGNLIHKGIL